MLKSILSVKVIILAFIFVSPAFAASEKRPTFFVLQSVVGFKTDLEEIYDPNKYDLILLKNKKKNVPLTSAQSSVFKEIKNLENFDFETLKKEILKYSEHSKNNISIHIITNDEYALALAGSLRDHFKTGEPGFNSVNIFLNKIAMKNKLLANKEIGLPKYIHFNPEIYAQSPEKYISFVLSTLEFPIFAKPIDDAGATGTQKIASKEELVKWLKNHKDKHNYELDEFIQGELYHCDSLIENGKILFVQVSKNNIPCAEFLHGHANGTMALSDQMEVDKQDIKKITAFNQKVLTLMSPIPNGSTHLEVFKNEKGEIIFLEIAARTAGASIPAMYSKHLGIGLEAAHLKLQMGLGCGKSCEVEKGPFTAWMSYPIKKGIVTEINHPQIRSAYQISWKIKMGDNLTDAEKIREIAMNILFWNDNYEQLKKDFDYLSSFEAYKVDNKN